MLKISIVGNLGKDAEPVSSPDGLQRYRIKVGANARKDDPTAWFSVLFTGRDGLVPYLCKGARVFVTGNCKQTISNGFVNNDVFADEVQLLSERAESQP